MADNSTQQGNDTIATDLISDGGVADGAKVPRGKLGYGTDGNYTEVSASAGLPVAAAVTSPVFVRLSDGSAALATLPVSLASVPSHAVTNAGVFATQIDGTALTRLTDIETNTDALAVVGNGSAATAVRVTLANDSTGTAAVTQSGTWNVTNISGTVSLPTGASTAAKQPALGTAGTASTDVITVQGITSMTPLLVTASAGTNLNTSALALESGGNLAGAATSLAAIDDWDESDRAKVNIIVGQAGIAGGTGVDGATVPRVSLATNVGLPAGTAALGKVGHDTTGIVSAVKAVTSAGTAEALAGSTACKWVTIQAQTDNTGVIAVGDSGVVTTVSTGDGILLEAGDTISIPIDNLADVFIDASVSGDGVRFMYGT